MLRERVPRALQPRPRSNLRPQSAAVKEVRFGGGGWGEVRKRAHGGGSEKIISASGQEATMGNRSPCTSPYPPQFLPRTSNHVKLMLEFVKRASVAEKGARRVVKVNNSRK